MFDILFTVISFLIAVSVCKFFFKNATEKHYGYALTLALIISIIVCSLPNKTDQLYSSPEELFSASKDSSSQLLQYIEGERSAILFIRTEHGTSHMGAIKEGSLWKQATKQLDFKSELVSKNEIHVCVTLYQFEAIEDRYITVFCPAGDKLDSVSDNRNSQFYSFNNNIGIIKYAAFVGKIDRSYVLHINEEEILYTEIFDT